MSTEVAAAVLLPQRLAKKLWTDAGTPEGTGPVGHPVGAPDGLGKGPPVPVGTSLAKDAGIFEGMFEGSALSLNMWPIPLTRSCGMASDNCDRATASKTSEETAKNILVDTPGEEYLEKSDRMEKLRTMPRMTVLRESIQNEGGESEGIRRR